MSYERSEILALRLRASTGLKRMTRKELFSRLQLVQTIEPIVEEAYDKVLRREWREKLNDSPHGHPWHVSFHASQFPGDNPMACARQAMYRMMDLPSEGPASRWLHLTAEMGKAFEVDLVDKLHKRGILISAPPTAEVQTGFEIPEVWLTGSVDSAIALRRRATPVEIKTKHEGVLEKMRAGMVGPDDSHIKQLKTQMGLIRHAQEAGQIWTDLKHCQDGYIYYGPRDSKFDPMMGGRLKTAEFYFQYDRIWFDTGIEVLKSWVRNFEEEVLVVDNPSKRHPLGWRWSYPPCQHCSYKKICQADHKAGVDDLSESTGIETAKAINPDYSYEDARKRVKKRWSQKVAA